MLEWRYLFGVASATLALASVATASESYDNPTLGGTPCVVLKSYQALSNGADSFGAEAMVENVCGRSLDVSFCFPLVGMDEASEPHCANGLLRPWATSKVAVSDLPARLAGPDYSWRWHGHLMGSDR